MAISSILAPSWEFMRQNLKTMKALPCKALLEYSVIKAGINHMGTWLAKELFNQNIRVNTLASGEFRQSKRTFLKAYRKCCASKGMLDADDICGTLVFLLSDESRFITGQTLVVDDGWGL